MSWRRMGSSSPLALAVVGVLVASGAAAPVTFPGAAGKLVFSNRGFGSTAELVNPDGSGRTRLSISGGYHPVWSADGRWLAYSTFPEPWTIRVVRADGTGDRELLPASSGSPATTAAYTWAPNGAEIAYPCTTGLCAVRVADGATRRVIDLESPARVGSPTWSPDGSRIAFNCTFIAPLCMVRPDGSDPIAYSAGPGVFISSPDWSPDGRRILFNSRSKIHAFDVDDGEVRLLVDMGGDLNARARWSPDGAALVVSQFPSIYVVRLDGSAPMKIGEGGQPDWGTSPAVSVADATSAARWTLGRQVGTLTIAGTASHPARLALTLRSAGVTLPTISAAAPTGQYTASVKLPTALLPGTYTLTVGGTSGGERLLDVTQSIEILAPASGIVSRASIGTSAAGPPRNRVPRDTATLIARFEFAAKPASGQRVAATWIAPSGRPVSRQPVKVARTSVSRMASDAALAPGRWRCRLAAGSTVLAVATVRVG